MNFTHTFKRIAISVAAIAAGAIAMAPAAHAQSGGLSLGNGGTATNCATFSGFTWNGTTLSINCVNTPPPPVQACDTTAATTGFHIVGTQMSPTVNSTATVTVARDGGCAGSYTINFGSGGFADPNQPGSMPTGWSATPSSSLTFAQGDTSKTISVATGTTPGLIGIWMVGGASVSTSGGMYIYVQPQPQANMQQGTCGSANYVVAMQNNNQVNFGSSDAGAFPGLKPGETVALGFTFNPAAGGGGMLQLSPVINAVYTQGAYDTEISIAGCAGVFQTGAANAATSNPSNSLISSDYCDVRVPGSTYQGQGITAISAGSATLQGAFCKLNIGQAYYINVRQVPAQNFTSTAPSCQDSSHGCTLRVQPQGLN